MPNETPFGSLESLVGRTFERDGKTLLVGMIKRDGVHTFDPDGSRRFWRAEEFISGAKEVTP
jgi:hypothetical protein